MKCCICGSEIMKEYNGWDQGHNAEPVMNGRCCGPCNWTIVIPTRLRMTTKDRERIDVASKH
jgi:hypothetical protein